MAVLDSSVLVRHFTHDPPDLGRRATAYLEAASAGQLLLTDVVVSETAVVLQLYYRQSRTAVARALRALLAAPQIVVADRKLLARTTDLYESGSSFVDAYVVAIAERESAPVASFDRRITRGSGAVRVEP